MPIGWKTDLNIPMDFIAGGAVTWHDHKWAISHVAAPVVMTLVNQIDLVGKASGDGRNIPAQSQIWTMP